MGLHFQGALIHIFQMHAHASLRDGLTERMNERMSERMNE